MPYPIINDLINKKREITPSIALRLAKFLGMSEDFWINLQLRWDLYNAKRSEEVELQLIKPFRFKKLPTVHPEALVVSGIRA
jgi:plasmid maintenance system antidote protein VapI